MSVVTVADNKSGRKPHYKDYVSFLGNYKNGKKDDQSSVITSDSGVGFSLNSSSNNSSSSVYSDLAEPPKNSFKEYLEHYNNKKYSPVQPPVLLKKQAEVQQTETKTVKTEVFLEINNPPSTVTKVVDVRNAQNVSTVSKVSKMFEKSTVDNGNVTTKSLPPSGKVNTFNFDQHNARTRERDACFGNPNKVTLKKSNSITEKSKVFEETNNTINNRKQSVVEAAKKFQKETTKTNGLTSPKPPANNLKPVVSPKITTTPQNEDNNNISPKTNGSIIPKPSLNIKPIVVPKAITETLIFPQREETISNKIISVQSQNQIQSNEKSNSRNSSPTPPQHSVIVNFSAPAPPPMSQSSQNGPSNIPPPPPMSQPPQISSLNIPPPPPMIQPPQNGLGNVPPAPPMSQPPLNGSCNIPAPPPPPPANYTVKKTQNSPSKPNVFSQKVVVNNSPRRSDAVDGTPNPVVDKSDPRVKKLVYGALREMYGNYHDKANDYIATIPRNRVRKNNGLDSIINSIASQGGLEKLNGRVNPSVETE